MIVWSQRIVPERVFAYRLVGGEWVLTQSIWPAHDAVAWDFGRRMHLDEDWLFVSAYRDSSTFRFGGSVFVYRREADGRFSFFQKLTVDFHGQFGVDLAYNGRSLLVGVPGYQPDHPVQGGIYAYSFDGDAWVLDQRLTLRDAATNDALGWNIVVEGDTMLASAQGKRTPESTGAVARFEQMPDGSWVDVDRLIPAPLERPQNYGNTVAMLDGRALVGSIDELVSTGEYHGAAYFFDLACGLCAPDLDLDGQLTIFDYLTFLNLFDAGDTQADFDGDGELTIFDFLAFQTAFDAGCA